MPNTTLEEKKLAKIRSRLEATRALKPSATRWDIEDAIRGAGEESSPMLLYFASVHIPDPGALDLTQCTSLEKEIQDAGMGRAVRVTRKPASDTFTALATGRNGNPKVLCMDAGLGKAAEAILKWHKNSI